MRSCAIVLAALLSGCFSDPGGTSGDEGSDEEGTAGTCPIGMFMCPCADGLCLQGLVCEAGVCVEGAHEGEATASAGSEAGSGTATGVTSATEGESGVGTTNVDDTTASSSASDSTGSEGTGGSSCGGDCSQCIPCATAMGGPCWPIIAECEPANMNPPECYAVQMCLGVCSSGMYRCQSCCTSPMNEQSELVLACVVAECGLACDMQCGG